jgi:small-conductance mechanosensitive channel
VIAEILAAAVAVALGVLAHYQIGRTSRRIQRWLARRRGAAPALGPRSAQALAITALVAQGCLWVGLALVVSGRIDALRMGRGELAEFVVHALRMPLFHVGERAWSALDALSLPLLLAGVWLAVGLVVRAGRAWVLSAANLERESAVDPISVLLRYALTFVAAIVVLQAWGVDVRSLAIFGSVLGVGIGFGLQNIANNFVSGLLIHLSRPVRPGDYVNVGEHAGTVVRVGARSTEIRTTDRVTLLIPNSRFLETEVVNWSHGDPLSRIHIPVGVAYGSDVPRVRRVLLEAASRHPLVSSDPRPQVQLRRFGESSLDFELLVWTRDPESQMHLTSDLNFRIEEALRRHAIQIPFPQRDLHVRSPALDAVLAAWRAAPAAGEVEVAAGAAVASEASGNAPAALPLTDRHPEDWDESEIAALASRLRGPGGVPVQDRRHLLTVHPRCFVGREAVDWLVREEGLARAEAVALGMRLVEQGLVHHVLDEHGFRDGHFFYRFREEQAGTL